MAIELKNSLFIHNPKCGGRTVKQMLKKYVKNCVVLGDDIYESHATPDTKKQVFGFIRHPATFVHSLWTHRSKKKGHGDEWNWPHLEHEEWRKPKVGSYWFWGFMRNTKRIVEVAEQKKIDWFFIDHAYLYHQRHSMFEKYGDFRNCLFRVCKNNYVINKITDTNDHRYLELKARFAKDDELEILDWKKNGKHIIVFPPSWWLCKNLGMRAEDVLQDTIDELKKHTDREIRVRVKKIGGQYNPVPLHEDLKDCHAVVSYQSSAAAKAIIKGIPSFTITDKYSAAIPMSQTDLSKIETPIYPDNRYEWLSNLANHQFYANEIQSGYAERYLNEQYA